MFKALFAPGKIGGMTVSNRIVMPAVHLNYSPDGAINPKISAYFRERARGGAGLLIVGGCAIDDLGPGPLMIRLDHRRYLPGLTELAAAVQGEGVKIAAQLYQAGRYTHSLVTGKQAVAPSPVPSRLTRETPRELTREEIAEIRASFVRAALLVQEAGFDAVEVLASAGYLISQFLSPLTNQRTDEYGGTRENRMRFGLEVVSALKAALKESLPVLVRVGGNDFMAGGNTDEEAAAFCRALEAAGADGLNVTGGWHETYVPQTTMSVPPGAFTYLARNIKMAVSIPVIACNRINDPLLAERILTEGSADYIGMARGLIADPFLPAKAQAGKTGEICKCIGCNQGCLDQVFSLQPVTCLVNPRAGREAETVLVPASVTKKILVVGGGPAGLEAARVAALRGHEVTLWEKSQSLGGQLNLAAVPPGRSDFGRLVDYLAGEAARLGVTVVLGKEAAAADVLAGSFAACIVATGARPSTPELPGIDGGNVVQAWDVLAGRAHSGQKVVVVGGGAVGVETALYLANQGALDAEALRFLLLSQAQTPATLASLAARGPKEITVVEMAHGIGRDIGISTRWTLLADLRRSGVTTQDKTTVRAITAQGVEAEKDGEKFLLAADTVVLAVGSVADDKLYRELEGHIAELYLLGDAQSPRKALDAMHEAFNLGAKV